MLQYIWYVCTIYTYIPWKSMTKQRIVFRMLHGFRIPHYQGAQFGPWRLSAVLSPGHRPYRCCQGLHMFEPLVNSPWQNNVHSPRFKRHCFTKSEFVSISAQQMWCLMWLTLHNGVLLPTDRMSPRCSASIVSLERSQAGFECRCSKVLPMIFVIPSSIWHDMDSPKASSLLGFVCHSTQVFLTHVSPTPGPLGYFKFSRGWQKLQNWRESQCLCFDLGVFATKLLDFECQNLGSFFVDLRGLNAPRVKEVRGSVGICCLDNLPRLQEMK